MKSYRDILEAKKITYSATTPDGKDTLTRKSNSEYNFATWVQFEDKPHQVIVGFSKNNKPVLQGGKYWKKLPHGVVQATVIG